MVNYCNDTLINVAEDGMTETLWQMAYDDSKILSNLNVSNDRERNLYFYLENFVEDLCQEFNCNINNYNDIIIKAFEELRKKEKIDLTDIRKAVYNSLKVKKIAYPNIKGTNSENSLPDRDINKWVKSLEDIYSAIRMGKNKMSAIKEITEGWTPMEKLDFEYWMKYYESADYVKYAMKKNAFGEVPVTTVKPEVSNIPPMAVPNFGPGRPRKSPKSLPEIKQSIISRIDSAIKMLRDFSNVWPPDIWRRIVTTLTDLQAEIVPLTTKATIYDCLIKTANKLNKQGFSEGSGAIIKIAQGAEEDLALKIEKALSGKESEISKEPAAPGGMAGDVTPPPGMEELMGPAPTGEMPAPTGEMPAPTGEMPAPSPEGELEMAPPAGVTEELPPPEKPLGAPEEEKISNDTNPFEGKSITVKDVLEILEPLSKNLSEREFVRSLSKADMMLDSMNVASHFPELGEVQSKALELNIYINTRLEKIISKLKGGVKEEDEKEKDSPPEIEMGEFAETPGKEKEMFEVNETELAKPTENKEPAAPTQPETEKSPMEPAKPVGV
jgi:hypothetical protein